MRPIDHTPTELTAEQLRIARLFAAMDERRQHEVMAFVAGIAQAFPRRAAPVLMLVKGGAA